MKAFFQAVGVTVLLLIGVVITVLLLYMSYILAIGCLLVGTVWIVYKLFTVPKNKLE